VSRLVSWETSELPKSWACPHSSHPDAAIVPICAGKLGADEGPADVKNAKRAVRDYWNSRPCGTSLSTAPLASAAFFAEVERKRYSAEPFIHEFASFARWRGASVLEIGTGIGSDFLNFIRSGARGVGIDITPAAIQLVRERLGAERLTADTLVADAEHLPFANDSFDLVYSWGVLHHTPETDRAIREVHRVLRIGGEARVMLYSRHSWVVAGIWLRYALARGHLTWSLSDVLARHLESPGTKAFTSREIAEMFAPFSSFTLRTFVTPYDRRVGGVLTHALPAGFFAGVAAVKR
jgi:ubiquinone/menaquinone biosynthesis C-methylase UbiE